MTKFLPFLLGEGLYGLELTLIQEVVDDAPIFYLPGAPPAISGAINLHGRILPVLDLPSFFGFARRPRALRMIILADPDCPLALAVDSVRSVLSVDSAPIKPGQNVVEKECVRNVLDWNGERMRLVDVKLLWDRVAQLCETSRG